MLSHLLTYLVTINKIRLNTNHIYICHICHSIIIDSFMWKDQDNVNRI